MSAVRNWAPLSISLVIGLRSCNEVVAQPVWHGPEPVLAVGSTEPPSSAIGGPHGIDLIYSGPNGHLYWQWRDASGGYSNAAVDLSDVGATSRTALVSGARNKLDAFYRGANGHLWTSWWDGTWWSAATDLGGVELQSAPAAVKGGPHRIDVFYVDALGRLTASWWDGGAWWSAPGFFPIQDVIGPVTAVTHGPHKVQVFYRSKDNRLWTFWSDGGPWSGATNLGTVITSNPSAVIQKRPATKANSGVDCSTLVIDPTRICRNYAVLFFRGASGRLCAITSVDGAPWGPSDCSGPNVSDRISAITVDEVFFSGWKTPSGTISNATMRVWREP